MPISEAAATQRAGRAGRVAPGTAVRLWSETEKLAAHTPPGIAVEDLTSVALQLAACGFADLDDVNRLSWLDVPPTTSMQEAHSLLVALGALRNTTEHRSGATDSLVESSGNGALQLTPHGRALSSLPLHPRLAHMLLCSCNLQQQSDAPTGVVARACALAAMLEEGGDVLQASRM